MQAEKTTIYKFGPFRLDSERRLLLRDDQSKPVELTSKVFDTLLVFLQNRGRVLDKKELMETLWPDSFVEESNLFQNVSILRKVLGESPQEHQYIVTVPGRGYRFVATVTQSDSEEALVAAPPVSLLMSTATPGDDLVVSERIRSRIIIRDDVDDAGPAGETIDVWDKTAAAPRPGLPARSESRAGKRKWLLIGLSLVACALALTLFKLLNTRKISPPFAKAKLARLTTSGKIIATAISPDARDFAYVLQESGNQSLWIKQVATPSSSVQITQPAEVTFYGLSFSPDGNHIYYVRSGTGENDPSVVYQVPALGGSSIKLLSDVDGPVTLSPDGKQMAFTRGYPDQKESSIIVANTDGAGERRLATLKDPEQRFVLYAGPAWSPDGKTIISAGRRADATGFYQTLLEVDVSNGSVKPLTGMHWSQVDRTTWLFDGSGLVFIASEPESLHSQVWYVSYPGGATRKITNDLSDYRDATTTRDGKHILAIQTDSRANLWLLPAGAVEPTQITSNNYDGLDGISWTPDGRIVYTSISNGSQNLWLINRDGSNPKQLTFTAGVNRTPVVTPDSRSIVFSSDRSGTPHLWRSDIDGSQPQELTRGSNDAHPALTPDGRYIFYRSYVAGIPNVFRIEAGGGEPIRLTDKISGFPAVSPDGKTVAYSYREQALSPSLMALFPFEGGTPLKTFPRPPGPQRLCWSNDGSGIGFLKQVHGVWNIWLQRINGAEPEKVTNFSSDLIFWFDWSRDGSLACARGARLNDVVLISGN